MYEEFKDTPFITQNRELQNTAYQNMNTALDNYQQFYNNPNVQQSVIDAYNNVLTLHLLACIILIACKETITTKLQG